MQYVEDFAGEVLQCMLVYSYLVMIKYIIMFSFKNEEHTMSSSCRRSGRLKLSAALRHTGYRTLEDRYRKQSIMISYQLSVAKRHDVIGESTIADGIMHRLLRNAHRIELKSESLRRKNWIKLCKF